MDAATDTTGSAGKPPRSTDGASAAGLTYASAGVSIAEGDRFAAGIGRSAASTYSPRVLSGVGGFAGLFALDYNQGLFTRDYRQPVLVAGTDGVGTKLAIARAMGKHDTVGIDLVAMCVNDCLCAGAEPLFFLDYVVCGTLGTTPAEPLIAGVVEGCRRAECALLGGETAEHPGDFDDGDYDVSGFCVGVVEKKRIIDGAAVKPGDVVIGLPSSGIHSNGFTLARRALLDAGGYSLDQHVDELGRTLGEELLEPTSIYAKPLLAVIRAYRRKRIPGAIAHITGGGLAGNLVRVLPPRTRAVIDRSLWTPQPIFDLIRTAGGIDGDEMYRVFNMGIGMALVAPEFHAARVIDRLAKNGLAGATAIGRIEESTTAEPSVEVTGELPW